MSMIGTFAATDAATLAQLKADHGAVYQFLYPDDGDGEPANAVDVDKAWHGIHYLLTGCAEGGPAPLSWAVMGGEEVGEDLGFGPARILQPAEVGMVSAALSATDEATLKARFLPDRMTAAQIYPDTIWLREDDQAFDYLMVHYRVLVAFYRNAAKRGDGVVLWLG